MMNPHFFTILAQAATTTSEAAAPEALPPQSPLSAVVPFILMAVIFYFLLIRPQQKRQKELNEMIAGLKVGDTVVMNSGIHGLVSSIKEHTLMLKVADNVKIEFDKAAVARVIKSSSASES